MKIRNDVADMLRAGHSDSATAKALHTDAKAVAAIRRTLGIPSHKPGRAAASSPQELFLERTRPVDGGHLEWNGYRTNDGTPFFRWKKQGFTAGRIAFVMQHGREPIGRVRAGCNYEGCVAPGCVEDQQMRNKLNSTFNAIFGGPS
ncbi:hypothetical protein [Streptomyces sp. NRRL B-24720]|uniref:hypothetical protein n=1 Tax=Streptomyces sp. NRRL B-24720 TaxID=1476876 RepID=UPI0006915D22|nr:hypothetical protein [Streptomyces sp. NRRL B-24720]